MPKIVKHSLISLVLINIGAFSLAHASTVQIQCHPIPYLNAASISATVNISNEVLPDNSVKASASFNATLKRQINGSVPFTLNSQVSGRVVSSVTQDAQGNTQYFKTFYAVSKGPALRVQLAVGANTGITANSFIQAEDGYYYKAKCSVTSDGVR